MSSADTDPERERETRPTSATRPIRVVPSLLAADFAHLADQVAAAEAGGADWLHVDVMDGHFVPNLTMGPFIVEAVRAVASVPLDVHLMVEDPWTWADRYIDAGAAGVTVHVETTGPGTGRSERDGVDLLRHIRKRGARPGITASPGTPDERMLPFLPEADVALVMSVRPGFGGQSFLPESLETVRFLAGRPEGWQGEIEIDGGIGPGTIGRAAAAGANVFVAGSSVFGEADIGSRIRALRAEAVSAVSTDSPSTGRADG